MEHKRIHVLLTEREHKQIKTAARAVGLGISTYMRQLAITQPQTEVTNHDPK